MKRKMMMIVIVIMMKTRKMTSAVTWARSQLVVSRAEHDVGGGVGDVAVDFSSSSSSKKMMLMMMMMRRRRKGRWTIANN